MADKQLLVLFRHAPYGRALSRGGYDLALAAAAFEQAVSVLFMDDGVWQLLAGQSAADIDAKNVENTLASLPLYDIEPLYADAQALTARGVAAAELVPGVTLLDAAEVQALIATHQQVLVF